MNRQAVFDKVKTHLLAQNKQALDPGNENCLYRAPGGLKCAIGCLISDEAYTTELEQHTASESIVVEALVKSGIEIDGEEDEWFLQRLQQIHDMSAVEHWSHLLTTHAIKYGLTRSTTQGANHK